MRKVTTGQPPRPEAEPGPEVPAFGNEFDAASPLDELVREGAQRMLQVALEWEVE
ncbi:MAG TPA: IS256 family transposase, partial [Planctomycetes bacterium]|nr:IS256 family transposase [Planctomycetota bacterium]